MNPAAMLNPDRWLAGPRRNPRSALRLFCFPYAGGSAEIYSAWAGALPDSVDVCPIQLPGRGARMREPAFSELEPLVAAVANAISPFLDRPCALFGHSMGATIAFQLARRLAARGREPAHLFVSGCPAPRSRNRQSRHTLPDEEFMAELRKLNGTPAEVLENREFMRLLLPTLRADFALCDIGEPSEGPLLGCPLTAIGGSEDSEAPPASQYAWANYTSGPFRHCLLDGDHFFINSCRPQLLAIIRGELLQHAPGARSALCAGSHGG